MGRDTYIRKNCEGEYNFQIVSTHDGTITGAVLNSVVRIGQGKCLLEFMGDVFRKLDFTGSEVTTLIEVYELAVKTTGGVPASTTFAVNKDRESGRLPQFVEYVVDSVGTPLVVDETGAQIMLREYGSAIKGGADRSKDLNLNYSLKPDTHYLIKSTILDGVLNSSQDVLIGTYTELDEV